MEYILRTVQKADKDRLARAATGLADGSITVKLIHQDSHEARALVRQFAKVLAHLPDELRAVVTFAYQTGWRIRSEMLTWEQIDLAAGTVRLEVGTTKNKEGRLIYLTLLETQWHDHLTRYPGCSIETGK